MELIQQKQLVVQLVFTMVKRFIPLLRFWNFPNISNLEFSRSVKYVVVGGGGGGGLLVVEVVVLVPIIEMMQFQYSHPTSYQVVVGAGGRAGQGFTPVTDGAPSQNGTPSIFGPQDPWLVLVVVGVVKLWCSTTRRRRW